MYGFKLSMGFIGAVLLLLLVVSSVVSDPEKSMYERTVNTLMVQEGLNSTEEVENQFPQLQTISHKISRIAELNSKIHQLTGGPAPDVNREKGLLVAKFCKEMNTLRRSVHDDLVKILHRYSD